MKVDWENIPTINAERVSLRRFKARDADAIYEIYSDPEVVQYWGGKPMVGRREASDFLAGAREDLRHHQCIQWAIARRSDDRLIGTIAFFKLDTVARKAEIGFALRRDHWGRGYMREALQSALGYFFDDLDFRRIEADVDPRNLPSLRLLDGLGFKREGYLRERWLVSEGTQDSLFYGLLKREWNRAGLHYDVASASHFQGWIAKSRLGRWGRWLH
jgi:RimJ/RimL family protein N-acetyltransferase